jgi:hypothetical protein
MGKGICTRKNIKDVLWNIRGRRYKLGFKLGGTYFITSRKIGGGG